MQQDILIRKQFSSTDDRPMLFPSLMKFRPHTPENRPEKMPHPLKFDGESVLNRQ